MLTRWRGGPATATAILILVCLLANTVYVGRAAALTDIALSKNVCVSRGWVGSSVPDNGNDGNDSTFFQQAGGSSNNNGQYAIDLGATYTVTGYRVLPRFDGGVAGTWEVDTSPVATWTNNSVDGLCVQANGGTQSWAIADSGTGLGDGSARTYTFSAPITGVRSVRFSATSITGTCGLCMYSFEFYGAASAAQDYIYNLVASHPPFARHYSWNWVRTYTGTWYVTNGASTTLPCTTGCQQYLGDALQAVPLNAGSESGIEIGCLVICGHDTYTIHITETGVGTVTYAIDSDLDGTLISTPTIPAITKAQPCYQKTTSSCASVAGFSWASISSTAGQAFVNYTFTGLSTYSYTVAIQQKGFAVFGTVARTPGSYTLFLPVDATATPQLILTVTGAGGLYVVADMTMDFSTGGAGPVVTQDPTQGAAVPAPTCDAIQVVCNLQQVFAAPGAALNTLALSTVQSIRTTMLTRQPFNFIVRAYDGVSGQLALASAAVTTTSTCTGLVLSVPLGNTGTWRPIPSGWALPTQPPATSMPVTVADCASLEPLGGQTWYQAVRTAMDPAIYLLFAYSQLRRLQPRPVMAA